MTPSPLQVLVCGNVSLELGFAAPAVPLPAAESTDFPGALTLGVSGVAYNVAHALACLGAGVEVLAFVGDDPAGRTVREVAEGAGIRLHTLLAPGTPLSLVLAGPDGSRHIYRDSKGLAEQSAPTAAFRAAVEGAQVAVLTNVGWTRGLIPLARAAGVPVVTDLQATPGPGHPHDAPFLAGADVVFLSAANLPGAPEDALWAYRAAHDPAVIVVGLGAGGALLSERGQASWHQPAVPTRPVVSTNGAGDALLAAFARAYFGGLGAREALRLACTFASWTCGEAGGAAGHLGWAELSALTRTG